MAPVGPSLNQPDGCRAPRQRLTARKGGAQSHGSFSPRIARLPNGVVRTAVPRALERARCKAGGFNPELGARGPAVRCPEACREPISGPERTHLMLSRFTQT